MNQDSTSDTVVNSLSSELEALKEIYLKEFQTENEENRTIVSVNLSPSTADLKDKQYVCLTLQLTVCNDKYPQESPLIHIRNPRGLSEETVTRIIADLNKIAEDRKGTNMLYHLIDFVKESLTSNNFPSDKCMICLYEFTKEDVFVVTKCFHHFHCYCLAHYIQKTEAESTEANGPANGEKSSDSDSQPCPVCREDQDFTSLVKQVDYPPPSLSSKPIPGENVILEEARQKQESFAPIFEKQQQQGGIINEEEEKNKFLLRTSDSNASNPSSSTSESTSKQNSPSKSSETLKASVISADTNPVPQEKDDAKSGSVESSTSNGHLTNENKVDEKEEDGDDKNEEWSDAKPEISSDIVEVKDESKDESKTSTESKTDDPSKSEAGSNKEETEITNGKTESETEAKDSAAEKDASKDKSKRNKSSRRNSRRNRTRSSGRRASAGDGTTKTTNGDDVSQNNGRRNRSRRRNRTNSYDPNTYGGDPRSQNYRPNNRGQPRMRGRGRNNNVGYSSNGGLPSPPYKRNFGTASYAEENSNYRSDAYSQDTYRDRDRPGFYAARVIRPSVGNNANTKVRNGTRGSEDSSKASISPQADSSEVTQSTSEQEQQTRTRSRSKNKRRNRRNRTASRSQNGRHSESDYQNSNQQGNDYSNSNSNKMNNRQGYNYNYNNYRSQGSYGRSSYGGGYYNGNYPNFSYGYSANYNGYGNGYNNNYNNNYYGRYNGNYGNYYRQRPNYNRVQQRNDNYRPNYKPRKRTDTGQSQSSVKSNSNNKTTETVPVQTENGTVVEIVA